MAERSATYREVFAVAEYRVLFAAGELSWVGDYFARVAITVLIFSDTGSVLLSAAGFATSYLPWVAGGPVLAALAERYPYRHVMLVCDVVPDGAGGADGAARVCRCRRCCSCCWRRRCSRRRSRRPGPRWCRSC